MKAWLLDNFGLDNLRLGEVPTPTPKDDEVLIRISAVSLTSAIRLSWTGYTNLRWFPNH